MLDIILLITNRNTITGDHAEIKLNDYFIFQVWRDKSAKIDLKIIYANTKMISNCTHVEKPVLSISLVVMAISLFLSKGRIKLNKI